MLFQFIQKSNKSSLFSVESLPPPVFEPEVLDGLGVPGLESGNELIKSNTSSLLSFVGFVMVVPVGDCISLCWLGFNVGFFFPSR